MTNEPQQHPQHVSPPSWTAAPITPPRQLGDGEFPPKVFYWKAKQRSAAWIAEHNPHPEDTASYYLWSASFHYDQMAGAYTWKRSNLHRVVILTFSAAIICAVLSVVFDLIGGAR